MPPGAGKVDSFIHKCPAATSTSRGPQDTQVILTSQSFGGLTGRHASDEADRRGEITSFLLKHLSCRLTTHSGYFQWSPDDYGTLSCSHDFKQLLKQKFCDMVSDPDLRDDRKLRPDLNRISSVTPCKVPTRHLKY